MDNTGSLIAMGFAVLVVVWTISLDSPLEFG
jgi:hypothetical protein